MSDPVVAVVCGVHKDRLLIILYKVLATCLMTQERGIGASQQGSTLLDSAHCKVMAIVLSSVGVKVLVFDFNQILSSRYRD